MSQQLQITGGAKVRDLQDVIIGTSGVLSSLAFNVANGVPKLDVNGKILVSQLPNSVMEYLGTWDASTNTPTLVNGTGNQGDVYLCNVAGTTNFGAGPITFAVGDSAIYSGTIWQKAGGATGTVTSVGLTSTGNDAITITGSPITTSGNINLGFAGTNLQYINGAGDLTTFPTLISSIGLSMPSAFSVANSPLTANGTIAVTGAGYPSQYIRGDGTLADFPTSGGGGSSVSYYLNGGTSQGTIGGVTYYEMSKTADTGTGVDFTKSGDGFIVAFLTDAGDPAQLNIPAGNWNYEIYASMSANGGTPEMYAELYKYDGTTFTLIATSSNEILYDGTNLNLYTFAMTVPSTTLAITDRLAIKLYATNSGGKTTTVHTQDSHLCQVITTFSTGITALNGLTAQVQYFATGTSGTDFNISSTTATHTFNIPDASASARGLITTGTQTIAGLKTITGTSLILAPSAGDGGILNLKRGAYTGGINDYTSITSQGDDLSLVSLTSSTNRSIKFDFSSITSGILRTYTLPNASGTLALTSSLASYVPYTGATANVDIGVNAFNGGAITTEFGYAFKILAGGTLYQTGYSVISSLADKISFTQSPSAGLLKAFSFDISAWANNSSYTYTLPAATGTLPLGTGTTNYHAKWTGTNTLGNSLIQDNGTNLSINRVIDSSTLLILKGIGATSSTYGIYLLNSASNTNFYINDAGNSYFGNSIGIGTSPTNLNMLDVLGAVKFSGQLTLGSTITNGTYTYTLPSATGTLALTSNITSAISGTTNYHAKFTGTNTIGNSLIWDNGTNVGIGNTNTSYTLDVSGTLRNTTSAYFATTSGSVGIGTITPTSYFYTGNGLAIYNASQNTLSIATDTSGTSSLFFSNGASGAARYNGYLEYIHSTNSMTFGTGGFTRLTLASTGAATFSSTITSQANGSTFGTTSTSGATLILQAGTSNRPLILKNSAGGDGSIFVSGTSTTLNYSFGTYSTANALVITNAGNIGIGTASPAARLNVISIADTDGVTCQTTTTNSTAFVAVTPAAGSYSAYWVCGGNTAGYINHATTSTTNYFTGPSDLRLKSNINDWNENVLELFSKVKPKTYNHISDNDESIVYKGYIAQEMVDKFPEAYQKDRDGYYSNNPVGFIPYLVKAIQEMNTKLDEQNQTIQSLQEQINILAK